MTNPSDTTVAAAKPKTDSSVQDRTSNIALLIVLVLTNVLFFAQALPHVH
jgi:hypothetical protein